MADGDDGAFAPAASTRTPTRPEMQARLDALVRDNRFTIAVVFPVVGAVLLVASAEGLLPPPLSFDPFLILLGTLVMRSPLLVGLAPLIDRRAAVGIAGLAVYAYAIEFVGLRTGWPYGDFHYVIDLGPTVAGVPVGLPVFFLPLVCNAYLLCLLLLGDRARWARIRLPVVIATVVAMDLVLDPGAVALGFWTYPGSGPVYGVPLSNFAGWVLSATVTVLVLDAVLDRTALLDRLESCEFALDDLVSFVLLWSAVNVWFGNWGAAAVGGLFGVGLLRTERFDSTPFVPPRLR
ncbi:bisanhydrobacterioruberin hydratase [Haloplanus aerogenes]|uniref:Carotenoid biosynthesis protein n=1 Tax=Haloplanus aerogenes TaxID=660522 RepID=A0A3M0D9L8_9EURY|nr:bisanhydrobacterioruberin hydratase [Haloplanus aerogenes]AZH26235.1 carotenoid biosynthesis protein [Haloplanus aerogenes]RMB18308.1 putative membrane protein [Haloplanus aerogenes]